MYIEDSGKWYKPNEVKSFKDIVKGCEHLILASNLENAIEKYKERYNWDYTDRCIDIWYGNFLCEYPKIDEKDPEYECTVIGHEVKNISFNHLKKS